jgi:hypothetical protein
VALDCKYPEPVCFGAEEKIDRCSLSQPTLNPKTWTLNRVSPGKVFCKIVLRSSSLSVSCSGGVPWTFCMLASCKPVVTTSLAPGFRQGTSDGIFGYFLKRKWDPWHCNWHAGDIPCFEGMESRKEYKMWSESFFWFETVYETVYN